jgi:hypothetical protein
MYIVICIFNVQCGKPYIYLNYALILIFILSIFSDGIHARQDSMDVNCTLDVKCNCGEIQKPLMRRKNRIYFCVQYKYFGYIVIK